MEQPFADRGTPVLDSYQLPIQPSTNEAFDLRRVIKAVWRQKWLLIIVTLAALAASSYVVSRQVPVFEATASILFEPERVNVVDIADVLSEPDARTNLGNQIEILTSTMLLERVVDRLSETEIENTTAAPSSSRDLEPLAPSSVLQSVKDFARPLLVVIGLRDAPDAPEEVEIVVEALPAPTQEEIDAARKRDAIRDLRFGISLEQIPGSRVIEINYRSTDRREAARIVNAIGEEYIAFQEVLRSQDVGTVITLMNERIEDLKTQLGQSEGVLEQARLELSSRRPQSAEMINVQINALNQELAQVGLQLASAEARHRRAAAALFGDDDLWSVTEFRNSPLILAFREREVEVQEQIARQRAITGDSALPSMTINSALLNEIRSRIQEEAGYIVAALQFEVESLQERQVQLSALVRDLEIIAIEQTADEQAIARLEREVIADQTLYQSFVDRLKEISEQANLQPASARFLSRAEVPRTPVREDSVIFMIAATLGGVMLGLFLIMVRERINNAFHSPTELSNATGLPVLASIPQSGGRRRTKKLINHFLGRPKGILAESIRGLRTGVLYADPGKEVKVVMFASSVPGEGKSSVSLLTAMASQQTGRSAILVSCDLRDRGRARFFAGFPRLVDGSPSEQGMLAYLREECSLDEALTHEPETGSHFLALGSNEKLIESPADLLSSESFAKLVSDLRQRYDLVILDTPPALAVTDARLLARLSDTIVYLVRWGNTNRNAVEEGLKELMAVNMHVSGCVFTMVSQRKARNYADNEFIYKQGYAGYFN
ncbi:MAG: Wzz/FepE/Etk N-terminal domain-containing protein [Pseudomonadota bacterium]